MGAHTVSFSVVAATVVLGLAVSTQAIGADVVWSYSGQFDLRIPADPDASKGWMEDAIIEVPDHLIIEDLDVSVSLTHTKVFDLQLFVEGPSGTRVLLNMYDPFGDYFEGEDYSGTTFDDESGVPIEEGTPPFEGRFKPLAPNSLAAFDGEDAYGPWRLQVYDAFHADTGAFGSFGLRITVPEPATVTFLFLGLGLTALPIRRRS
jgi:hypothetical protein